MLQNPITNTQLFYYINKSERNEAAPRLFAWFLFNRGVNAFWLVAHLIFLFYIKLLCTGIKWQLRKMVHVAKSDHKYAAIFIT